ncbi:hypothetical protein Nepgr_022048 [Nepenthes gracilis]|uniref:Uncharacterized protein n=1 Tax=Nepenthes gracilis TaxID=150966 RepID=A0AAD3T140_NEPGR|nr:hypothetical protein Nepgr_022048 [Nepenthes gracilis]
MSGSDEAHLVVEVQCLYFLFDVTMESHLCCWICRYVTNDCMEEGIVSSTPVFFVSFRLAFTAHLNSPWKPCAPSDIQSQLSELALKGFKRLESEKNGGNTKTIACINLQGLLFFILFFGKLVPIANIKNGGTDNMVNLTN